MLFFEQPMLCVSAVNPYLYFRVPILVHLRETRKRLSKMLACIRCPSRSRIQGMVGSRRYLLESNDFYALRDLTDLSKGAFAGKCAITFYCILSAEFALDLLFCFTSAHFYLRLVLE